MIRFFDENITDQTTDITLYGDNAHHAIRVLRVKIGENVVVCNNNCKDFNCVISSITEKSVLLKVESISQNTAEPTKLITLFQGIAKGDKMDTIIQKAVEMGANSIVPVITARCVVKLTPKDMVAKVTRWQKIAYEAARQCGRGRLPIVEPVVSFLKACELMKKYDASVLLYEEINGHQFSDDDIRNAKSISFMVGPEGGFDSFEIDLAKENNLQIRAFGKRIMRTETAGVAFLSVLMYLDQ